MVADNSGHPYAHIQEKIDLVVGLIAGELSLHASEHADDVLNRISKLSGLIVETLDWRESHSFLAPKKFHGNTSIEAAIKGGVVVVADPAGEWRLAFRYWRWKMRGGPAGSVSRQQLGSAMSPAMHDRDSQGTKSSEINKTDHSEYDHTIQRNLSKPNDIQAGTSAPQYSKSLLIREFNRREQERGLKAGFVINDLLPRLGFTSQQSRVILRQLEAQNIVNTVSKANPNDPLHPTTFVELNHNHPLVKTTLGTQASTARVFPLGKVDRGEPVSSTILRERR